MRELALKQALYENFQLLRNYSCIHAGEYFFGLAIAGTEAAFCCYHREHQTIKLDHLENYLVSSIFPLHKNVDSSYKKELLEPVINIVYNLLIINDLDEFVKNNWPESKKKI